MTQYHVEAVDHTDTATFLTTEAGVAEFPRLAIAPPPGSTIEFSDTGFTARHQFEHAPGAAYVVEVLYEPSSVAAYLLHHGAPLACIGETTTRYGTSTWGNGAKHDLELLNRTLDGDNP